MFIETKTITVKEGTSDLVVNRFSQAGEIEKSEGFIDLSVLVKKVRRGDEEVIVMIRWESEEAWKSGKRAKLIWKATDRAEASPSRSM